MTEIHIRILDPIWMDAFREKFKGFVISYEKDGNEHQLRIGMSKILKILLAETDEIWKEAVEVLEEGEKEIECCKKPKELCHG